MCDLKGRQQLLFIMHVKIGHVRLGELAGIGLRPGGWGEWWHTWKLIWLGLGDGVRQQPSSWSCHGGQSTPRRNSGASACSAYFAPVREHVKTSIFMQGTRLKYQRRGPEKNAYVRVRGIPAKECAKAHRPELQESSWEVSWWRSIILINFALIQSRGVPRVHFNSWKMICPRGEWTCLRFFTGVPLELPLASRAADYSFRTCGLKKNCQVKVGSTALAPSPGVLLE